jgi:hypothetical protein
MGGERFFIEREMAEADIDGKFGFVSAQSHGFALDSHQTNSRRREKRGAMSSVDRSVEARARRVVAREGLHRNSQRVFPPADCDYVHFL